MKVLILALTACAFLLAPLPALSQDAPDDPAAQAQDVEMPREVRVLVQRGLAVLGFDPGPADGLFGPKTRAAIWDWQAAKELNATGYLTLPEAEALAAIGAEASESLEVEFEEPAERESDGTEAETTTAPKRSRNQVLYFPTCGTDNAEPDGCWLALAEPAECVIWVPHHWNYERDWPRYSWSGECDDTSRAFGRGTLKPDRTEDDGEWYSSGTGETVEGVMQGHWVWWYSDEHSLEGPYVDGLEHGRWIGRIRSSGSATEVYEYENEYRHGELVE